MNTKELEKAEKLLSALRFKVVMEGLSYDTNEPIIIASHMNVAFGIPCDRKAISCLKSAVRHYSKCLNAQMRAYAETSLLAEINKIHGRIDLSMFDDIEEAANFFCFPF